MEEGKAVAESQDGNQAVHGTVDGEPLFSQVPVNIRRIHVIRELGINLRKKKQIFFNRAVLGIVPDPLEGLLNDHSRSKDMIALLPTLQSESEPAFCCTELLTLLSLVPPFQYGTAAALFSGYAHILWAGPFRHGSQLVCGSTG